MGGVGNRFVFRSCFGLSTADCADLLLLCDVCRSEALAPRILGTVPGEFSPSQRPGSNEGGSLAFLAPNLLVLALGKGNGMGSSGQGEAYASSNLVFAFHIPSRQWAWWVTHAASAACLLAPVSAACLLACWLP